MDAVPFTQPVSPTTLLGWLNFSDGRPDPRFQQSLNQAYAHLATTGHSAPWSGLHDWLIQQCQDPTVIANPAFRDLSQAKAVIPYAFDRVLVAYREHHTDLLAHLKDTLLFSPFFLARVCEAVLAQGPPWEEGHRVITGAMRKLNDFVGHRPIAVLETRPQTEFYPHEKVRPIPLYLRGVGPGFGPFEPMIARAVEILGSVDDDLLLEAAFDIDRMHELALDPRAYDFAHPANRRANYMFGEWDPHCIDQHGNFTRFVLREVVLDALLAHAIQASKTIPREQAVFESAAVLSGTMLMASAISGFGPETHDSAAKLGVLVPKNARLRDAFYTRLVAKLPGEQGDRLRAEASKLKQPFGGIRRHLNHVLSRQRAAQLQDRKLAVLFAELGFARAARERVRMIPTASARFLTEIQIRQTIARRSLQKGNLASAANLLPEIEELLNRGIQCGALADPWNILGFQGMYPLFQAREDSIPDPRIEEMIDAVSQQFDLYARLMAGAASEQDRSMVEPTARAMKQFAGWWDRYATADVSDIPRVLGEERVEAASHVSTALAKWSQEFGKPQQASEALATGSRSQLKFWRSHREGFNSPPGFAQVIEALLARREWNAAMTLLMTWLSDAEKVPLENGIVSFHQLAERWFDSALSEKVGTDRTLLCIRFFEMLEANAETHWNVPESPRSASASEEDSENRYDSAYEDVTYQDSTDDGRESSLLGDGEPSEVLSEAEVTALEERLLFLETTAKLWCKAGEILGEDYEQTEMIQEAVVSWVRTTRTWEKDLQRLTEDLHQLEVPSPIGELDDVVEYQRHKALRDDLVDVAIDTCVQVVTAGRCLRGLLPDDSSAEEIDLALAENDPDSAREALPTVMETHGRLPLLFVPLSDGGTPRRILQVRTSLAFLETLFSRLPRLGLIRETYHLVKLAKTMELNEPPEGRKVSDFERLYHVALRSVVETVLAASTPQNRDAFHSSLRKIVDTFLNVWIEHSQGLRLSTLELVSGSREWEQLRSFVRAYGNDLFTTEVMHMESIRGILHRGVGTWLDTLMERDHEAIGRKLIADIRRGTLDRDRAARMLELCLQSIAENYDAYREYDATSTLSDYGENLHIFLEVVRLRVNYQRFAWRMRPVVVAHEALCRKGFDTQAERWRDGITESMHQRSEQLLRELDELEAQHGLRLQTIRDRLEERFLQPFLLDRLCASVQPAARETAERNDESGPAFQRLAEQLQPLTANPSGAGLDTPPWLKRLENEVEDVRVGEDWTPPAELPVRLTYAELQRQLKIWEHPLAG